MRKKKRISQKNAQTQNTNITFCKVKLFKLLTTYLGNLSTQHLTIYEGSETKIARILEST